VAEATDKTPQEPESQQARAGRTGGAKGGNARVERMTSELSTPVENRTTSAG